jgi:hypothetical protein
MTMRIKPNEWACVVNGNPFVLLMLLPATNLVELKEF